MNIEEYTLKTDGSATIVSIVSSKVDGHSDEQRTTASIEELKELLINIGIETDFSAYQKKESPDAATMVGKGKLLEISDEAKRRGSKFLVFDFELTASQMRNIKNLCGLEVIDRNSVILEIFARNARTKEARIQVEISKLNYILPRLTSMWTHFTKQKGGIGLKGEGEQQLELDRRIIRKKIERLEKDLKEIKSSREQRSKKRNKKAIVAALVGYTNAGKSSIMNRLCKVNVLEENKLFATLDSTYRMLNPDTKPPMILVDTVGFISNLPNTLVEGFKTTLESALEADLLIHVCDLSNPDYQQHIEVTNKVLNDLGIEEKKQIMVFTKKDKVLDQFLPKLQMRKYEASFFVSTYNEEDMKELKAFVIDYFLKKQEVHELFIPYDRGEAHSLVSSQTNIIKISHHETGIFYAIKVPTFIFERLNLSQYKTEKNIAKK